MKIKKYFMKKENEYVKKAFTFCIEICNIDTWSTCTYPDKGCFIVDSVDLIFFFGIMN